jgi:undecaprenyl-diphosphatase
LGFARTIAENQFVQELWKVVVLAIVQGVTEFLPISSDGHLVVASLLLGVQIDGDPRLHDLFVVLHFGTLLSIVVIYYQRLLLLLGEDRKLLWPLFLGSIPAGIIGLLIKKGLPDNIESLILLDPAVTGIGFVITGAALLVGGQSKKGNRDYQTIKPLEALTIGCAQALAILPGISRSGMTISTGLKLGLAPRSAATFSFLLGAPIIFAATLLEAVQSLKPEPLVLGSSNAVERMSPANLAIGVIVSFAVGVISLKLLIGLLERGKFQWFAWWCIPLGLGLLIYAVAFAYR